MIVYIQFHQDRFIHPIITTHQAIDIGNPDITITTIFHHIHTPAHFIAITYIHDPTIHHITGEITLLTHICTLAHIFQDTLQLEAGTTMITFTIDQFHIIIIDHIIVTTIPAHYIPHIIHHSHHIHTESIFYKKKLI